MPAVLTHKSVLLLATDRLTQLRDVLANKIARGGPHITSLERELLEVAKEAVRVLTSEPHPRTRLPGVIFARPLGRDRTRYPVSQFAVMGSMGPDIPAFGAIFKPGQAWSFDTVHKGTPDGDRELVNASTCDLAFAIWRHASRRVEEKFPAGPVRDAKLDQMRAYVLGHLSHVAADVLSHPFVNEIEFHLAPDRSTSRAAERHSHSDVESAIDAQVARTVLRRDSTRSGQDWDVWWPEASKVPDELFEAYAAALEDVYKAVTRRRVGLFEFESHLQSLEPPAVDADFFRDAYTTYRGAIVGKVYGYGFWPWFGWLAFLFLPTAAIPVIAAALPRSRGKFQPDDARRGERATFELLTAPLAVSSLAPLVYSIFLGTVSTKGVGRRFWLGVTTLIANLVAAGLFFSLLGLDEFHPGCRWPLLFGLPLALSAAWFVSGIVDSKTKGHAHRSALGFVFGLPAALWALSILYYVMFFLGASKTGDTGLTTVPFWMAAGFWILTMIIVWIALAFEARDVRIPERLGERERFVVDRRHFVRLFDDATLHHDPRLAAEGVPAEVFASGRRKLLKIWWAGAGELFVRSDRYRLVFARSEAGADAQEVPAPIAPANLAAYVEFLTSTVRDTDGTTGKLQASIVLPSDPDTVLPPGATFSDHGDEAASEPQHEEDAAKFRKLGTSADDTDYVLYHAPQAAQSVHFGASGPSPGRFTRTRAEVLAAAAEGGLRYVHDPIEGDTSETVMSYAADFAAILCLGGATQMARPAAALEKTYQVFRNWNLDRRRVNEWRTLVAGGALSDKGEARERYDDRMLREGAPADPAAFRSPLFAAGVAAFDEGESTARGHGWVRTFRDWMEIVSRSDQDPLARDGLRPDSRANQALGRAMAYLFDRRDPQPAP